MTVGEIIRELRLQKGLTQKQLGDLCGMADSAIRRYESGRANPKLETIKKIADALDTSIDILLEDNWEKYLPHFIRDESLRSNTLAAHFEGEEFTDEELTEIKNFVEFVKSKRKDTQ